MHPVKDTIVEKCLSLADDALRRNWTFHDSTEALFWFRAVLKVDSRHTAARLGAARAYQYIASQPWWHNDVRVAKKAAVQALALAEQLPLLSDIARSRERALVCGQIYSAIGQVDMAERYLNEGISIDPQYSVGQYFLNFNRIFVDPTDKNILPGLSKAVELAELEGNDRRLAAALYFKGFANTLFENYREAIKDLERSATIAPRYGSANLALIAATVLARRKDTYKVVRHFKAKYPNFNRDVLNYMWVERSSSQKYLHLVRPIVSAVSAKLAR